MKSGGPWNLRGLRPEARAAAREAARRSGMSVGEWLNTLIRPAEEREAEPRQSARSDRHEGNYQPRRSHPDDRELDQSRDRAPPRSQIEPEIDYDKRGYDPDQEREWERHAARRAPHRGEPRRRPSRGREESWERGFGDEELNRERDRRMSRRRPPEVPTEHWTESFSDEPEREREQYYDSPRSPRESARDESRRQDAREHQRDRHRSRLRSAPSRDRDAHWPEDSGAAERGLPPERYRELPRRASERNEEESWQNVGQDKRQREETRPLSNREPDEDRFEDLLDEGEGYGERYRNPPRLAPEREPENSSWESFSEEETDRYFGEPSLEADGEREDAERSNFDHGGDRAPRRRPLLEPEEPFETIPREGRHIRERGPAPRRYAPEPEYRLKSGPSEEDASSARRAKAERHPRGRQSSDQWEERFPGERDEPMPPREVESRPRAGEWENLPPQRTRLGNREEHRRRRDARQHRQGPSDDEQWPPEQATFRDESARPGSPYRDELHLGAGARQPLPPAREQRREVILPAADPEDDRDAAVDKAITEITVRQRALDEAAAAEMAARLRRAEHLAAQRQPAQHGTSGQQRPASPQHPAALNVAAEAPQPPASAGAAPPSRPASIEAPAPSRAENAAAAPATPKVPDHALVAEITARMRALDSKPVADRKTPQMSAERQIGAAKTAPQGSLVDDVAADILAEKNEPNSATGAEAFSLQPVSLDVSNANDLPAGDGRKNAPPPTPHVDFGGLERRLRELTAKIDGLRPTGEIKTEFDGLRRELTARIDASRPTGELKTEFDGLRRELAARIDALRPTGELKTEFDRLRRELAEIGQKFTEALPQHALESLEFEIKILGQRINDSRESGADAAALAGIEHGLAEVRETLRGLTPAEELAGFGDAIAALTKKVDAILAKDDPAALEQLHIAISNLRHAVSRVASDDALSRVAEDVRSLSAKIDGLARSAADNRTLAAIESRIDALTTAIHASTKAGHGVPRELEKLLSQLVDKLEWSQLTQTDHTALTHLEDRIAMLMQRLDASDARLGLLEGVERGLADLLVYIEQLRAGNGGKDSASGKLIPGDAIEHEFAEIKDSERRTQDSLEAVQGTVEHVVDRLARIESDMRIHRTWSEPAEPFGTQALELAPSLSPAEEPEAPALEAPKDAPKAAEIEPSANRRTGARSPIDPNLPPDHPLEPGAAAGRTRRSVSPAERIAALGSGAPAKPPVIPDPAGGKADFIAAARRAAQAAASTSPNETSSATPGAVTPNRSKKLTERLRTLFVAAAVVVIVVGGFRVVSQMFDRGGPPPQAQTAPPRVLTEPPQESPLPLAPSEPMKQPAAPGGGASGANTTNMPKTVAVPGSGAEAEQNPAAASVPSPVPGAGAGQSSLLNSSGGLAVNSGTLPDISDGSSTKNPLTALSAPDVTGSLPPSTARNSTVPLAGDKLPSAIGGPALRTAAAAGDPAAAYEVGVRFAEGRNVPQNNEEAARWLEVAAKKGFVPAQFRLGTLYEKGVGVKKDLPEALGLYRAAADKGHGKAMHNLAVLYAEGAAGSPDYRTAAQWFRKAADLGVTDSQYNLAILYARGVGVEQSFAEAYKWFFLAAKQGDKDAAQKRDEVASRLDQQTLAAAQAAAEQWTAQPQPAEAVTVKASDAWDAPAKGTSALKPKSHSAAKVPAPDVMKVD